MAEEITRVEAPSREEFMRDYAATNTPVILTGVASRWRAVSDWTPEYLKSVAGDRKVTVHFNKDGNFFDWYVDHPKRQDLQTTFGELLDLLLDEEKGRQYYMTEHKLRLVSPDLLGDVDFMPYIDTDAERYETMLFLGRDTSMPLHYHSNMEAMLAQIEGEKRITLYSPEQYSLLYPRGPLRSAPVFSQIEGRRIHENRVDLGRFPKFQRARPMEFTLHPGEILFIPVHWWHLTSVPGYQVSVTHFFRTSMSRWTFPAPGLQVMALQGLRPAVSAFQKAVGMVSPGSAAARANGHDH